MQITVLGAGNTGQAFSGYLASKEQNVTLYTRSEEKAQRLNETGIRLEGVMSCDCKVFATSDLKAAVASADLLIVSTTAPAHREVCLNIKGYLKNDCSIIIFNGNWGALTFQNILGGIVSEKNLTIAETGAMIFIASASMTGKVHVKKIKEKIEIATTDPRRAKPLADSLKELFPQLSPVGSVYETSFNNSNPTLHVPLTLFNLARIDMAEPFRFYGDGASPLSIAYVEGIDKERVQIGEALNISVLSTLDIINSFWPRKYGCLFDAIHGNDSYVAAAGPRTLDFRYVTEDIPFGMVPLSKLGDELGVETPYVDTLIHLFNLALKTDFYERGPDLNYPDLVRSLKQA